MSLCQTLDTPSIRNVGGGLCLHELVLPRSILGIALLMLPSLLGEIGIFHGLWDIVDPKIFASLILARII